MPKRKPEKTEQCPMCHDVEEFTINCDHCDGLGEIGCEIPKELMLCSKCSEPFGPAIQTSDLDN